MHDVAIFMVCFPCASIYTKHVLIASDELKTCFGNIINKLNKVTKEFLHVEILRHDTLEIPEQDLAVLRTDFSYNK